MKILFVVQRYGQDIVGGAELHCRLIAAHLARLHEVEIATTCAASYLTWENVYPKGSRIEQGITVHRFDVAERRPADFDILAHSVLYGYPSKEEEIRYIQAHGPFCPDLVRYLESRCDIDRFILFSYRYWTTWLALQRVGDRSILVPTAEHDRTIYLKSHLESFQRPAAIAYNSHEERSLIRRLASNTGVPGITVGVGITGEDASSEESNPPPDLPKNFFLYIGRIEAAKGCRRLIADYLDYHKSVDKPASLVFIGKKEIDIPDHPGIFYLGIQPDAVKNRVLSMAMALVMPSRYESLSMVLLEAWALSIPVIVNGHCEVLLGQCARSGAGLYYRNTEEFIEILALMASRPEIGKVLGERGKAYFQSHYSWPVILEKYDRLLALQGDSE